MLVGCGGEENYAEGLTPPPTTGIPTVGPGSGKALGDLLFYRLQVDNPTLEVEGASCEDAQAVTPGTTVDCRVTFADEDEPQPFHLRMDDGGLWHIGSPEPQQTQ